MTSSHEPKKRRFFQEDVEVECSDTLNAAGDNEVTSPWNVLRPLVLPETTDQTLADLYEKANGNIEVAVNMFWESQTAEPIPDTKKEEPLFVNEIEEPEKKVLDRKGYYIGDMIVIGWSSTKGKSPVSEGDDISLDRVRPNIPPTKKIRFTAKNSRDNTVVRLITSNGVEFGRLPSDAARWISKLLDFDVCAFYGTIVACNSYLSTGDDIIIQLSCYFTEKAFVAFDASDQAQLSMFGISRSTSKAPIFDKGAETDAERLMKERRLAIISLFKSLAIFPLRSSLSKANEILGGEGKVRDLIAQSAATEDRPPANEEDADEDAVDETKEVSDNQLDNLYEKAQMMDAKLDEMEPPDSIALKLRSYQKQALSWMVRKENVASTKGDSKGSLHPLWEEYVFANDPWKTSNMQQNEKFYVNPFTGEMSLTFKSADSACRGGILADEMGLGKTIEMLSIIHANRPVISRESSFEKLSITSNYGTSPAAREPMSSPTTLIVCPMSLLAQWRDECIRASNENTLKVEVYYGTSRESSLLNRLRSWNGSAPDVLITTYGTVLSEWIAEESTNDTQSMLYSVQFWRVILDEAHHIKNRLSKTSKACSALSAIRRWVVTGTPIQNKLEDLFALVHFLKHEPWSNYSFWRAFITIPFQNRDMRAYDVVQTVLEPIVLRRTKTMRDTAGKLLVTLPEKRVDIEYLDFTPQEQDIYNSLFTDSKTKFSYFCAAGKALSNYASIFQLLMRLRQVSCHPYLVVKDGINKEVLSESGSVSLEELIERFQNSSTNSPAGSPAFGSPANESNSYGMNVLQRLKSQQLDGENSESECTICFESAESAVLMPCMHMACRACVLDYLQKREDDGLAGECPICRHGPITEANLLEVVKQRKSNLADAVGRSSDGTKDNSSMTLNLRRTNGFKTSSKLDALIRYLRQHAQESAQADEPVKSVVFSQFTTFLDLIEVAMSFEGLTFVRLDGTQSQIQREKALKEFREGSASTMLISLRAGGVGLNLTCASRVYMMDPWWNFAVEAQAIDRVHRLGQKREVIVKRFIMRSTVEEKILAIQDRKSVLANGLYLGKDDKRTLEDLHILFGNQPIH